MIFEITTCRLIQNTTTVNKNKTNNILCGLLHFKLDFLLIISFIFLKPNRHSYINKHHDLDPTHNFNEDHENRFFLWAASHFTETRRRSS